MARWKQRQLLKAGSPAPEFELSSLDGRNWSLRRILENGPALLSFFKVTCPVCQLAFPFLERMHKSERRAVQFFGISQDDAQDTAAFNREFTVTFPTLLDPEERGYAVSNAFGISVVPTLFLVEQDGTISWVSEGFSKTDLEELGRRAAGSSPFRPGESVPAWRPG